MRIISIVAFILVILTTSSCQQNDLDFFSERNNEVSTSLSQKGLSLVAAVEDLPQSLVFLGHAKLSPEEKVIFWNRHVDKFLSNPNIDKDTKNHIKKLKDFISVKLYKTLGTPETEQYIRDFEKKWLFDPIAEGKFDPEILVLASSLNGAGKAEATLNTLEKQALLNAAESTCNCIYSIYCSMGGGGGGTCNTGNCTVDHNVNCGITGTSNCSGTCG